MLVGLTAQAMKPFLNRKWYAQLDRGGQKIPRYGGMPSAHTAFIFSLATVVGMASGFMSSAFAIAAVMVVLVLDDALRMRIFLSRHGRALRLLVHKLPADEQKEFPYLEARLGHKVPEVLAGATIGIGLTWLIMWFLVR